MNNGLEVTLGPGSVEAAIGRLIVTNNRWKAEHFEKYAGTTVMPFEVRVQHSFDLMPALILGASVVVHAVAMAIGKRKK